jgi:hypothetical protein
MKNFNRQPRMGAPSPASKEREVKVAFFGSPRRIDEKTAVMAVLKKRSFANLGGES